MVLWFGVAPPYHTENLWFYFQQAVNPFRPCLHPQPVPDAFHECFPANRDPFRSPLLPDFFLSFQFGFNPLVVECGQSVFRVDSQELT